MEAQPLAQIFHLAISSQNQTEKEMLRKVIAAWLGWQYKITVCFCIDFMDSVCPDAKKPLFAAILHNIEETVTW